MNFTKLKYVAAVDREASITAAARRLNISQSAVTKAVADIEAELGFSLFDRRANGVSTTLAGREFVDRAARILSDVEQLGSDMRNGRSTRDRLLRVAVMPPSLEGLMNRAIVSLLSGNAEMRLHMRGASLERGVTLLRQGDVDVAVGPAAVLEPEPGFACTALPVMAAHLYSRKGHPLTGRVDLSPADIARYPIIVPDIQGPLATPLLDILELLGGNPLRRVNVIEVFPIAAQLVEQTDAIGVVLRNFARARAFRNRFDLLDFPLGDPVEMAVARRKDPQISLSVRRFETAMAAFPPTA